MQNTQLPPGYISLEEALDIIRKDDGGSHADVGRMTKFIPNIRPQRTVNIWLAKRDASGQVVKTGCKPTYLADSYEAELYKKTLLDKFRELTGRDIDPNKIGIRSMTTAVDDEANPGGRIKINEKPMTKYGDEISNEVITTNQ